ncbi:MAG: GerMN domain-containing protein [Spirochaetales bacterium]|nr:GerMN domain-containing protein [Spirochaetales bacterium]
MEAKTKHLIIWTSAFGAVLCLSILLFITNTERIVQRVLYFPDETTSEWSGEARNIIHKRDIEEGVHELLKELILGPMKLRLERTLPQGTGIRSVMLRDGVLYADFSEHLAAGDYEMSIDFDQMLEGVKKTILFNLPKIEDVVMFVGGYPIAR